MVETLSILIYKKKFVKNIWFKHCINITLYWICILIYKYMNEWNMYYNFVTMENDNRGTFWIAIQWVEKSIGKETPFVAFLKMLNKYFLFSLYEFNLCVFNPCYRNRKQITEPHFYPTINNICIIVNQIQKK